MRIRIRDPEYFWPGFRDRNNSDTETWIRDNHPGSATLVQVAYSASWHSSNLISNMMAFLHNVSNYQQYCCKWAHGYWVWIHSSFAGAELWIRICRDSHWFGSPGSGSVLGMRIRIRKGSWPNKQKTWFPASQKALVGTYWYVPYVWWPITY